MSAPGAVDIQELLSDLGAAGIVLGADDEALRFQTPPGVSIGPCVARIMAHKPALLAALRQRQLDADMAVLDHEWTWLENHPDDPRHDETEARWTERLRRYERACRLISRQEESGHAHTGTPVAAAHAQRPPDDEDDPDDPVAETARRIAALSPDELRGLRAEIAGPAPDDPHADHDRAALARFDAMAGGQ